MNLRRNGSIIPFVVPQSQRMMKQICEFFECLFLTFCVSTTFVSDSHSVIFQLNGLVTFFCKLNYESQKRKPELLREKNVFAVREKVKSSFLASIFSISSNRIKQSKNKWLKCMRKESNSRNGNKLKSSFYFLIFVQITNRFLLLFSVLFMLLTQLKFILGHHGVCLLLYFSI